jgi:hypothetical protein
VVYTEHLPSFVGVEIWVHAKQSCIGDQSLRKTVGSESLGAGGLHLGRREYKAALHGFSSPGLFFPWGLAMNLS